MRDGYFCDYENIIQIYFRKQSTTREKQTRSNLNHYSRNTKPIKSDPVFLLIIPAICKKGERMMLFKKTVWTTKKEITPRYAGDNLSLFSEFFL